MKLIYEIFKDELEERLDCKILGFNKGADFYDIPMLYRDDEYPAKGVCLISPKIPALAKEELDDPQTLLIICSTVTESTLKRMKCSTFAFSEAQTAEKILNVFSEIFLKYNRWEDELRETLYEVGTITDILRHSFPIFNNTLSVMDSSFRLVSRVTAQETQENIPAYLNDETMQHILSEFASTKQIREPIYNDLPPLPPTMAINIYDGDFYIGVLSVSASNRKIRSGDAYLLTKLTKSIKKAFLLYHDGIHSNKFPAGKILLGLLNNSYDPSSFEASMDAIGIQVTDTFCCFSLQADTKVSLEFNQYFIDRLGSKLPVLYIPSDDSYTLALIDVTRAKSLQLDYKELLAKELQAMQLCAGISDLFHDLYLLKTYITQAVSAVKIGTITMPGKTLFAFEDCWLEYILSNCTSKEISPAILWPAGFIRLVEHDNTTTGIPYIETLKAYLFNNMNALQTANSLYISRNALMARIDRIQAILEMNLNDPLVRFQLTLCIYSLCKE